MHTLTETLHREAVFSYSYQDSRGLGVLCISLFAELMNRSNLLPNTIKVTISTRPIRGAARVPVRIDREGNPQWIDWDGTQRPLHRRARDYLRRIGVRRNCWTDIWVDWAPVTKRARQCTH